MLLDHKFSQTMKYISALLFLWIVRAGLISYVKCLNTDEIFLADPEQDRVIPVVMMLENQFGRKYPVSIAIR